MSGDVGEYLGSSLAVHVSGGGSSWTTLSPKPLFSGWVSSLFHMMVPTGYSKLQEERLAMVDLGAKPEAAPVHNGYRAELSHTDGRRLLDRASRSSTSSPDSGDGAFSETEPMLSGEETDEEDEDGEDPGLRADVNMPKESPLAMALQILVPFLLAGFGTVSAGMVLDVVQVRR